MNNKKSILDQLEDYFVATPRPQIDEDWAKCEMFDNIGITVDEFMSEHKKVSVQLNNKGKDITVIDSINEKIDKKISKIEESIDNINDEEKRQFQLGIITGLRLSKLCIPLDEVIETCTFVSCEDR